MFVELKPVDRAPTPEQAGAKKKKGVFGFLKGK